MAMAFELKFAGGTTQQYDEVIKAMGFRPRGIAAEHAYFHWVAKTGNGLVVVDVWDSQAEFDKFAQEKIGPLTAKAGLAPPEITAYQIHNYLWGGQVKQAR